MLKKLFFPLFILTIIACGEQKPKIDEDKRQIDNICDSVMKTFTKGNFSEAFDILKENAALSLSAIDTLKVTTVNYANNYFPTYGKIRSYEFVSEHKIKDIIIQRLYILKFDKYYLKFDFTLYNNGDKWTITSFAYNENLIELFY